MTDKTNDVLIARELNVLTQTQRALFNGIIKLGVELFNRPEIEVNSDDVCDKLWQIIEGSHEAEKDAIKHF